MCAREAEEKRQAAWDEEEERIATELAEKAAALVAKEKLKVAWEAEELEIAEEISVRRAAAVAEMKRRDAWEIEEVGFAANPLRRLAMIRSRFGTCLDNRCARPCQFQPICGTNLLTVCALAGKGCG